MELYLVGIVLIVAVVAVNWRYRHNRSPSSVTPPPVEPVTVVTEEDSFYRAANAVADDALNRLIDAEAAHIAEVEPLRERARIAFKRLEESGVSSAVTEILDEIWHWPSWMKRGDWTMPIALPEFEGGELDPSDGDYKKRQWYKWERGGKRYTLLFELSRNQFPTENEYAQLKVMQDDILVADFNVSQKISEEYDHWNAFGLDAFSPGQWMIELNELAAEIEASNRARRREQDLEFYASRASRIDLD